MLEIKMVGDEESFSILNSTNSGLNCYYGMVHIVTSVTPGNVGT